MPRFGGPGHGPGGFGGHGGFGHGPRGGFGMHGGFGHGPRHYRPWGYHRRRYYGGPGCLCFVLMPVLMLVGLICLLTFLF